jgi:hypothetical protein
MVGLNDLLCTSRLQLLCNTFTGLCQQCLDDYDCIGPCGRPTCNNGMCINCYGDSDCDAGGYCIDGICGQCRTGDDCVSFPNYACNTTYPSLPDAYGSQCIRACTDNSQCPTGGGRQCLPSPYGGDECVVPCVMADDAGGVSDAGNLCPSVEPLCVANANGSGVSASVCSQCLSYEFESNQIDCDAGACRDGGFFICDGLACLGACN